MLLRRYDREAKANKRLSMDKEELEWRLTHDTSGIGAELLMNRSISHSPPSSTASTPEPTRRSSSRKSPHIVSPRSPRGGAGGDVYDNRRSNGTGSSSSASAQYHNRRKVKSSDFDRPVFSPRHSSADLYANQVFVDSNDNESSAAPPGGDDSLMSASTHSEPCKASSPSPSHRATTTTLRRSGTYELLTEELFESAEDEDVAAAETSTTVAATTQNLKQTDV